MKSKTSIFKVILAIISRPVVFVRNLYFWYKIDKRRRLGYNNWLKAKEGNKNRLIKISQVIESQVNEKGYFDGEELHIKEKIRLDNIKKWDEDQEFISSTLNGKPLKDKKSKECSLRCYLQLDCDIETSENPQSYSYFDSDSGFEVDDTEHIIKYEEDLINNLKNLK